jgi:hypothetical protein
MRTALLLSLLMGLSSWAMAAKPLAKGTLVRWYPDAPTETTVIYDDGSIIKTVVSATESKESQIAPLSPDDLALLKKSVAGLDPNEKLKSLNSPEATPCRLGDKIDIEAITNKKKIEIRTTSHCMTSEMPSAEYAAACIYYFLGSTD